MQFQRTEAPLRLRRTLTEPDFMRRERGWRRAYPHKHALASGGDATSLQYRKTRWHHFIERGGPVRSREVFCWLCNEAGEKTGALQFFEYDAETFLPNEEFFYALDSEAEFEMRLANVLCTHWSDFVDEVIGFGTLVDFRHAWTHPSLTRPGVWAEAARWLLSSLFGSRGLLTMKAFPLEYEGQGACDDLPFQQRQAAMIRYYAKLFAVRPFPGAFGDDGWLYAIPDRIRDHVDEPAIARATYVELREKAQRLANRRRRN